MTARSFRERRDYAWRTLRSRDVSRRNSRRFDNCFEMYDGAMVVVWLMRLAERDERLADGIRAYGPCMWAQWQAEAAKHEHLADDAAIEAEAKRLRDQGRLEAAKRQSEYRHRCADQDGLAGLPLFDPPLL